MKAKKAVVVYNPEAGRIRARPRLVQDLVSTLRQRFESVEAAPTPAPGAAAGVVRHWIGQGSDLVCVAGGDGTVNEALPGIAGTRVPLIVLPAGTANVLSCEIGTGNNALRTLQCLDEMEPVEVAPGVLRRTEGERLFLCMAGAGLDARIVRLVRPEWKRRLGKLSYWEGGLAQLGRKLEVFEVLADGRRYECSFALMARVRNYGGDLWIARHANLLEERLAVVLFEGSSSLRYLKYFTGVLTGRLQGMRGVHVLKASRVQIPEARNVPVDLQVDGEHAGFAPAEAAVSPLRVRLLVPRAYAAAMRARAASE
ncbi:MAG: diacylglycerol kinase family protein [Bryobacteraceae bacterium]